MKKKTIFAIVIILTLFLSGCGLIRNSGSSIEKYYAEVDVQEAEDNTYINVYLDKLIQGLNYHNTNIIKNMFSKDIREHVNLNAGMKYLNDVWGNMVAPKTIEEATTMEIIYPNKLTVCATSRNLIIDSIKYSLVIVVRKEDKENLNREGLYMVYLINSDIATNMSLLAFKSDYKNLWQYANYQRIGIYVPENYKETQ